MAKSFGPLLSIEAHGKFGERLTFSKRESGQQVRFQRAQKDFLSAARITQRALYREAVESWRSLTDEQKYEWRVLAIGKHYSGYNLYVQNYLLNPPVAYSYLLADIGVFLLQENLSKIII